MVAILNTIHEIVTDSSENARSLIQAQAIEKLVAINRTRWVTWSLRRLLASPRIGGSPEGNVFFRLQHHKWPLGELRSELFIFLRGLVGHYSSGGCMNRISATRSPHRLHTMRTLRFCGAETRRLSLCTSVFVNYAKVEFIYLSGLKIGCKSGFHAVSGQLFTHGLSLICIIMHSPAAAFIPPFRQTAADSEPRCSFIFMNSTPPVWRYHRDMAAL